MTTADRQRTPTRVRPLGEDAPTWLTVGFGAIGLLVAGAAAWLVLSAQPAPQAPRSDAPNAPVEQAATPATAPQVPTAVPADGAAKPTLSSAQHADPDACPPPVHIPFPLGSATPITKDVQMEIETLQAFLNRHSQASLSIEGHADAMGAEDYNLLLSYRRAKAAVAMLGRAGLPEARMAVRAAGNGAPIAGVPGDSARNRRVVLQVVGIEACQQVRSGSRL